MDVLMIDLNLLRRNKLSITDYLTLLRVFNEDNDLEIPFQATKEILESLIGRNLIKFDKGNLILTEKSHSFFKSVDVFDKFYKLFPTTVPDGTGGRRPVSTGDLTTKSALKTKKIWNTQVGTNEELQEHVIKCLQAELKYREQRKSLMYLNNVDTWLRQSNWEKWSDMLNGETKDEDNIKRL